MAPLLLAGVSARPASLALPVDTRGGAGEAPGLPTSPASPASPEGGRVRVSGVPGDPNAGAGDPDRDALWASVDRDALWASVDWDALWASVDWDALWASVDWDAPEFNEFRDVPTRPRA